MNQPHSLSWFMLISIVPIWLRRWGCIFQWRRALPLRWWRWTRRGWRRRERLIWPTTNRWSDPKSPNTLPPLLIKKERGRDLASLWLRWWLIRRPPSSGSAPNCRPHLILSLSLFFFFLCVFVYEEKLWVYGFARDWIGYWVYGFISLIYLWFGLVSWIYFLFFWIWWSRFGLWIWIWGLLEISLFHGFMKNTKNNFSPYEKIMKVKKKKFKFCFLIYFLFWFKLSDMDFYKKLKCLRGI